MRFFRPVRDVVGVLVEYLVTAWKELRNPHDARFRALLILVSVVLAGGTIFYHLVEHWSLLDALYFCVITLATIGYGDFVPQTQLGRAFTIFYVLGGLGILAAFATALGSRIIARRQSAEEKRQRGGE